MSTPLRHPTDDTRDAVDGYRRTIGNGSSRIEYSQDHRDAALSRQRREMRRATAELRDHGGDLRQNLAKRRSGHLRDQHIAGADRGQLALAIHDARAPGTPADTRRMPVQTRMMDNVFAVETRSVEAFFPEELSAANPLRR